MWYDIYTAKQECKQELKNNSGLIKRPVSSHPASIPLWATGGQLSEATKMSTVGGNIHSNAPGVALKAVPDMTFTAFCKRSSSTDLLAGYVKLHELEESSCLWRKKLTSLSLLPITHKTLIFSPSAELVKGLWSRGRVQTRSMHHMDAALVPRPRHTHISSCRLGLNQMPGEKQVSLLMLLCCDWALRAVVVLTDCTTKFRLNHRYDLD